MKQQAEDIALLTCLLNNFCAVLCTIERDKKAGGCLCSSMPRSSASWDQAQDLKDEMHSSCCIPGRKHAAARLCWWGSCTLYSPHTLWQQKPGVMRMIKELPGEVLVSLCHASLCIWGLMCFTRKQWGDPHPVLQTLRGFKVPSQKSARHYRSSGSPGNCSGSTSINGYKAYMQNFKTP